MNVFNLTGVPKAEWSKEQLQAAAKLSRVYSESAIIDVEIPALPPEADSADVYDLTQDVLRKIFNETGQIHFDYVTNTVFIIQGGDPTVAFTLVQSMRLACRGVYAAIFNAEGEFVRFRKYIGCWESC